MNKITARSQNTLIYFTIGAIPIVLFISILAVKIPHSISQFWGSYSPLSFLLLLALYYASFRLPDKLSWFAGVSLTMLIFGMRLSFLWASGYSGDELIGGLLPYRDGFHYYNGAQLIIEGHLLPKNSMQAAFRPLFPGFLSSLLVFTRHNLQWTIAIVVGFTGIACYLSARAIRNVLGGIAAAVYMTLLYFYSRPLLGFVYTESLGLTLGCLGFTLLMSAARTQMRRDLIAGLVVLVIALSARAGAFFIFPMIALWAGWAFRRQERFSFRSTTIALITFLVTYLLGNAVYARLMVEPGVVNLGSFAYTIYGQVHGGAGYNLAIQEMGGVRDPNLIFREAWRFFLAHPISFFIGAAKAYRDFLSPHLGIFSFYSPDGVSWVDVVLWVIGPLLIVWGSIRSIRKIEYPAYSLSATGLIGIILSVPFLPPIDGGSRFYASTMPFYYLPLAIAVSGESARPMEPKDSLPVTKLAYILSSLLLILTMIAPVVILRLGREVDFIAPICPVEQTPYAVKVHPGSFIDLIPDHNTKCGYAPEVCLSDFKSFTEMSDASDFELHEKLAGWAENSAIRVFPANDLLTGSFHFFVGPSSMLNVPANFLITGCASEFTIKKRPSLYYIETVDPAQR